MAEFTRYRVQDHTLTRIQDNIESFALQVQSEGIRSGRLIENVEISNSGSTRIYHGLERKYLGYILVSADVHATLKVVETDNTSPKEFVALVASAAITKASLWVF
jgi:hypothetical protein